MAGTLNDIYAALNAIAQTLGNMTQTQSRVWPNTTASSSSVTPGTITFSSSLAAGFMIVTTSSGGTVKVPFYNQ